MDQDEQVLNNVYQQTTKPQVSLKFVNVLDLLDSTQPIYQIATSLSGYEEKIISGKRTWIRVKPPEYTDQFLSKYITSMRIWSNPITTQTTASQEQLLRMLGHKFRKWANLVFTVGRDHYISQLTWDLIIQKHREWHVVEINGKKTQLSGWYKHLDSDWNPNSYVTLSMIQEVRPESELRDHGVISQDMILDHFFLLHSAAFRSKDSLTLEHLQNIERIQQVRDQPKKGSWWQMFGKRANNVGG